MAALLLKTPFFNASIKRGELRTSGQSFSRWYSNKKLFDKILIANRGEIALRVMRTAKNLGIKTVAVYSEPDANALHVRHADEAVCIGGHTTSESYLVEDKILEACAKSGAQAVHPGYGFLSERASFVRKLEERGIVWIGPPSTAMEQLGDKLNSKVCARKANVNVVPGFVGSIESPEHALKIAHEIGFPVMIKASAGGGGKGMRVAWNDEEVKIGYRLSKQEAKSSFGDDRLLIEKFVDNPRHIEIQVIGDKHGNAVYLNERECSIQRRNQKVIEEAPSPFLDAATRHAMGSQAVSLVRAVNYYSAGTCEFLVDSQKNFYFLEMNTRLQVEHPVTEYITGYDLVEFMIRVAAGEKLPITQDDVKIKGWSLESRVYAEDPLRGFLPSVGTLTSYKLPHNVGKDVRVDSGVEEGTEITVHYDPLICKLITHGPTRNDAIKTMEDALDSYVIRGLNHNASFLRAIMSNPRFLSGNLSTKFIQEEFPEGFKSVYINEKQAKQLVAVSAFVHLARARRDSTVNGKLPSLEESHLQFVSSGDYVIGVNGKTHNVHVVAGGDGITGGAWSITIDNEPTQLVSSWAVDSEVITTVINGDKVTFQFMQPTALGYSIQYMGTPFDVTVLSTREQEAAKYMKPKVKRDTSKLLVSPMPGFVVSVAVKPGEKVVVGQELVVVEAMKMQNVLRATKDGVVKAVKIKEGTAVAVDQILLEFE